MDDGDEVLDEQNPAGHVLLDHFRLEERLGSGGGAVVFRAMHCGTGELVAVKRLRAELARHPAMVARFLRESQIALTLEHPSIPRCFAARLDREGVPCIVQALLIGRDLEAQVEERSPLPPAETLRIAAAVARTLGYAHARGVVHRDVKPSNVFLVDGVDVAKGTYLLDFGLAFASFEPRLSQVGVYCGTPEYTSPEQALGEVMTPASDVYSLGATLMHLLTGEPPWSGSTMDVLKSHLESPPPSLRARRPELPDAVEQVVHAMMQKDPSMRPASAADLAETLESLARWVEDPGAVSPQVTGGLTWTSTSGVQCAGAGVSVEAIQRLRFHAQQLHKVMKAASGGELRIVQELTEIEARRIERRDLDRKIARHQNRPWAEPLEPLRARREALGEGEGEEARVRALEGALNALRVHARRDQEEHLRRLRELEAALVGGASTGRAP